MTQSYNYEDPQDIPKLESQHTGGLFGKDLGDAEAESAYNAKNGRISMGSVGRDDSSDEVKRGPRYATQSEGPRRRFDSGAFGPNAFEEDEKLPSPRGRSPTSEEPYKGLGRQISKRRFKQDSPKKSERAKSMYVPSTGRTGRRESRDQADRERTKRMRLAARSKSVTGTAASREPAPIANDEADPLFNLINESREILSGDSRQLIEVLDELRSLKRQLAEAESRNKENNLSDQTTNLSMDLGGGGHRRNFSHETSVQVISVGFATEHFVEPEPEEEELPEEKDTEPTVIPLSKPMDFNQYEPELEIATKDLGYFRPYKDIEFTTREDTPLSYCEHPPGHNPPVGYKGPYLLQMDGDTVVVKTTATQRVFAQMQSQTEKQGSPRRTKLTREDFFKYFENQGEAKRDIKKLYKKFDPKNKGEVSFKDFNELLLAIATMNTQMAKRDKNSPRRKKMEELYNKKYGFPVKKRSTSNDERERIGLSRQRSAPSRSPRKSPAASPGSSPAGSPAASPGSSPNASPRGMRINPKFFSARPETIPRQRSAPIGISPAELAYTKDEEFETRMIGGRLIRRPSRSLSRKVSRRASHTMKKRQSVEVLYRNPRRAQKRDSLAGVSRESSPDDYNYPHAPSGPVQSPPWERRTSLSTASIPEEDQVRRPPPRVAPNSSPKKRLGKDRGEITVLPRRTSFVATPQKTLNGAQKVH